MQRFSHLGIHWNGVTIVIAMGRSFDTIMGVDYWCHAIHVDVMNYVIFGIQNSHCLWYGLPHRVIGDL